MTTVQAQPYYDDGMDDRQDIYRPTTEYPSEYTDRNSDYNSYGPKVKDYGNDNSYGPKVKDYGNDNSYGPSYGPSYGMDNSDKKSYGKDDNRDKSKDSSKSVDIEKINCINTNTNINGNNTGDINLGNKGQVAEEGYPGAYSSGDDRYGGNEGYYDGNYKKDKSITCIINNNNNNTNIVAGGGGNVTDGNGNVTDACEECFNANATLATIITDLLANPARGNIAVPGLPIAGVVIGVDVDTIAQLCDFLEDLFSEDNIPPLPKTGPSISAVITAILTSDSHPIVSSASVTALVNCLLNVDFGGGTDNNTSGLVSFDINTNTAGGLAASNINTEATGMPAQTPNINTDTTDFGSMMTLPIPSPSLQTFDR
jgi:hypothetical protein